VSDFKANAADSQPRPRTVSRNVYFLTIAVVAAIGFAAGTRSNQILGAVAPVFGFKVETGTLDLSSVQTTYQQLKANFDGKLDPQALIDGASRGMVTAAGDQWTVFMDAKEAKTFNDDLSGTVGGGIGAEIGVRNDQPTIVRILPDNPAEQAGMKAGDVIAAINGESTNKWAADKTADKVRGDVGTTVKITVKRAGKTLDFSLTRAEVNNPSVSSSVKGSVGIITISRFDEQTGELARRAADSLKQKGVKSIILDLRDNGGGYVTAAQDVASLWLQDKTIVTERVGEKVVDTVKTDGDPILRGMPTVVLVNGSTASASEIVSGALQEYHAATLIGEQTFGKGTVQKVINLSGGRILKVTVARWYTPKGRNITKQGITPNKIVKMTAQDVNAGRDPQLDAALLKLGVVIN
jgi:carboxyl-terminal processing protease